MAQSRDSTTLHEGEKKYGDVYASGGRHCRSQPQQNYMGWGRVSHQVNTEQTKARDVHDRRHHGKLLREGYFWHHLGPREIQMQEQWIRS